MLYTYDVAMGREHLDGPALPLFSRANEKKNHSGFSMFWDIINSWLDIQIGFEKKNVLERKKSCIINKIRYKHQKQ